MSNYRVIQLTNKTIGALAVNEFIPFGIVTRRIQENCGNCPTFNVTTSQADTVLLNELGNYNVNYSASLVAGSAGIVSVALLVNGIQVYEVEETATAESNVVNVTLPYQVRVCPNCASSPNNSPIAIQIQLTGIAVTGGQSNLLVERVY